MSKQSDSSFFVKSENVVPAGKPLHLEKRFPKESTSADVQQTVETNRKAIQEAKQQKLAENNQRKLTAVEEHRRKTNQEVEQKLAELQDALLKAENNRTLVVQKIINQAKETNSVVKEKAVQAMNQRNTMSRAKRRELERKLNMAAFRRDRFLRVPRSKLLETVQHGLKEDHEAATLIQKWYRGRKFNKVIKPYLKTNLNANSVKSMTFEELGQKMQDKSIIHAVLSLLKSVYTATEGSIRKMKQPERVFLSSFLIISHPKAIFETVTFQEEELIEKANVLQKSLEEWIGEYKTERGTKLMIEFVINFDEFYSLFENWKNKDKKKYIEKLIQHYLELEQLWNSVSDQVDFDTQWKPKLSGQKDRLEKELLKIGGEQALQNLKEKLESFEPVNQTINQKQTVYNDSVVPENKRVDSDPVDELSVPNDLSSFGMTNEYLAHELVLDSQFELKENEDARVKEIKNIAKRAFFDNVRKEFNENRFEKWIPALFEDIKNQLLEMVQSNQSLVKEINESIDIELIKQQTQHNVLDTKGLFQYCINKLKSFCAPVRDPAVRKVENMDMSDLTSVFVEIFDLLDLMKLDLANFKLSQLKPHLKQQIIPYEQAKFKALVDGGLELKVTREWLKGICETANATATTRNPEQINLPENKPKMNEVFVDAMLSLLSSSVAVIGEKCPETLRLDESRIVKMQNELQAIAIVASLLMLMKTTFVELRRNMTELKKMRDILLLLLQDPSTTISHLQVQLLDSVKTVKGSVTSEEEKLLNTMVDKTLSFKDTVYIMVQRRIIGVIRSYVLTGKFKPEILPRQGLDLVANELAQLADKFILLVEHNRQVHAPWYDEIINEFIQ